MMLGGFLYSWDKRLPLRSWCIPWCCAVLVIFGKRSSCCRLMRCVRKLGNCSIVLTSSELFCFSHLCLWSPRRIPNLIALSEVSWSSVITLMRRVGALNLRLFILLILLIHSPWFFSSFSVSSFVRLVSTLLILKWPSVFRAVFLSLAVSLTDFCSWEQIAQIVVGEFFASLSLFGENQESFAISEGLSLCDAFSEVLFQFFFAGASESGRRSISTRIGSFLVPVGMISRLSATFRFFLSVRFFRCSLNSSRSVSALSVWVVSMFRFWLTKKKEKNPFIGSCCLLFS